jgi:hypothetical protein
MKRKIDFTIFIGYSLLIFGLFSTSYGIIAVIIRPFFGYLGIILYVKDVFFDLIFILLGLLIIRRNKNFNLRSNHIKRKMP